jgi:hypothetical protein
MILYFILQYLKDPKIFQYQMKMKMISMLLMLPFLLTSLVQARKIAPKVVTCGDHGTSQTNIVAGNEDYFATV